MNRSCIELQKAGLIGMKLQAQFLATVGCSRFAAVWRSEQKQPILRLRYACGGHRSQTQGRRSQMQETRKKDSRESDIVFTQRFGQNANRLTRTQIGRDETVLAEADVTQRTVAEPAQRWPHPAPPLRRLPGDSPHKLRMAVLRRFHGTESFGD